MFQKLQHRLLLSYLVIFASILMIFAVGVRIVFIQSLNGKFRDALNSLVRSAASDMELENGRLEVKGDFSAQELNQKKSSIAVV